MKFIAAFLLSLTSLGAGIGAAAGAATTSVTLLGAVLPILLAHPTFVSKSGAMLAFVFTLSQGYAEAGFQRFSQSEIIKSYIKYTVLPCIAIVALLRSVGVSAILGLLLLSNGVHEPHSRHGDLHHDSWRSSPQRGVLREERRTTGRREERAQRWRSFRRSDGRRRGDC